MKYAFPDPAQGAVDQSFRLIVKPDLWGDRFRIRLANTFGNAGDHVRSDLRRCLRQRRATSSRARTARCRSAGRPNVNIPPGGSAYSDAVDLKLRAGCADRRTQARRVLPRDWPQRPYDVAREGAADVVSQPSAIGRAHQRRRRRRVPIHHDIVVFPRCGRCDGAGRHGRGLRVRRFDHRRHAVDVERRRPMA